MLPLTAGEDGRHNLAGSKTAVALGERDRERLERLARMRTAQAQTAARARALLLRDSGETLASIAERVGLAADSVRPCAAKYLEGGVEHAPSDGARSGRPREIDDADRALVVDLTCQRPADLGHSAEPRASDLPWAHAGKVAEAAGHPRLATVATGSVRDIPADAQTEPHKMAHCCERRDPDLEAKTRDVPLLHEQPSFRLDEDGDPVPWEEGREARALSHDERPGIRDARERRPRPAARRGRQGYGQARLRVQEARDALPPRLDRPAGRRGDPARGRDAQELRLRRAPQDPGRQAPKGDLIRIVPGDVSARASAETRRYLATVLGRLEFVSAPKHGSRPDLVEGLFSRMARQMLRGIRVSSKGEPEERILRYLGEADAEPVVYRWR